MYLLHFRQYVESNWATSRSPSNFPCLLNIHSQWRTNCGCPSTKETGQGFTPPPALLTPFGMMSGSAMLYLTGECGTEEVRTLRQGRRELCEDYWTLCIWKVLIYSSWHDLINHRDFSKWERERVSMREGVCMSGNIRVYDRINYVLVLNIVNLSNSPLQLWFIDFWKSIRAVAMMKHLFLYLDAEHGWQRCA